MKNTILFIILFGCLSNLAVAHSGLDRTGRLNLNTKITFGKDPDCGAGKGVCSLIKDDLPIEDNQIEVLQVYYDRMDSVFVVSFRLSEFKYKDKANYDIFIDKNLNPTTPKKFEYCYIIGSLFGDGINCNLPSPGIFAGQNYDLIIDSLKDRVTLKFHYAEVITCTNP